ncbi:hypothetical protein COCMIDRAFT_96622 [Bipolaris oryzae ATCC 44560]|uniref:BZIP domain-containing protein n=1 Tax=Bipolaris oryzae ATCC 44560 TaxID=930090 RepID=W6ZC92_COCMI|nr:uncharacterized protein COCMIDRAFT_96622 [Bipolaris oryzae ATCC 44560]EUC45049.1 hypothetical protein COCMIDRAFT_96622 [Bipolaris oryzae ATCC 44560]
MNPPSTALPSESLQRGRQRTRPSGESAEAAVKPKKVNSEIRKQQNRIASRNYREKRKRKLQYLQQLISDETDDHQRHEPSPEQQETYTPSYSRNHSTIGSSLSPYQIPSIPSNNDLSSLGATSKASQTPIMTTTTTSFGGQHGTASHAYGIYSSNWNAHPYSPPPPPPANAAWNVPPAWTLGFEHPVQTSPQPSLYHYSPEPPAPIAYHQQTQNLSQQSHEYLSNAYVFGYGSSPGPQHQVTHNLHLPIGHEPFTFERFVYI